MNMVNMLNLVDLVTFLATLGNLSILAVFVGICVCMCTVCGHVCMSAHVQPGCIYIHMRSGGVGAVPARGQLCLPPACQSIDPLSFQLSSSSAFLGPRGPLRLPQIPVRPLSVRKLFLPFPPFSDSKLMQSLPQYVHSTQNIGHGGHGRLGHGYGGHGHGGHGHGVRSHGGLGYQMRPSHVPHHLLPCSRRGPSLPQLV